MATKKKKSSAKRKSARSGMKRGSARKSSAKRARKSAGSKARKSAPKRSAAKKKKRKATRRSRTQAAVARMRSAGRRVVPRVKRVTQEVVQQASDAMSAGVETIKDLGGNLMDRMRTDTSS